MLYHLCMFYGAPKILCLPPPLPKKITQGNEEMKMIEQQILYSVRVREQRACVVPRMRAQYTYKV